MVACFRSSVFNYKRVIGSRLITRAENGCQAWLLLRFGIIEMFSSRCNVIWRYLRSRFNEKYNIPRSWHFEVVGSAQTLLWYKLLEKPLKCYSIYSDRGFYGLFFFQIAKLIERNVLISYKYEVLVPVLSTLISLLSLYI